jgi:hypothetical protein
MSSKHENTDGDKYKNGIIHDVKSPTLADSMIGPRAGR